MIDVISAECALGMNIFKDIANAWRDVGGGRAASLQGVLKEAKTTAMRELRQQALSVGADAVIGVDLDYTEITSSVVSGGMLMVVATGTAVRCRPYRS